MLVNIGDSFVRKKLTYFTYLCQCLFFNKVTGQIKKGTLEQAFYYEFCEISKNTFFTEHF